MRPGGAIENAGCCESNYAAPTFPEGWYSFRRSHARHGWPHPIYKGKLERMFMSRVNASGVYEQGGSERGEGVRGKDETDETDEE
jgi:hypothetical protein